MAAQKEKMETYSEKSVLTMKSRIHAEFIVVCVPIRTAISFEHVLCITKNS